MKPTTSNIILNVFGALLCSGMLFCLCMGVLKIIVKELPKPPSDVKALTGQVSSFQFNGHEYLSHYSGGLLHSQSCQCLTNKP